MSGGHFGFPDNTGAGPADLHATMDLGYGGVGNLVEDALIEPTTRSHAPPGNPAAASGRRWALKRATDPAASRPSKSPRRSDPLSDNVGTAEGSSTPWPSAATGRSPLGHKPTPLSRPGDLKTQLDASADPSMPNPTEPTGTPGAAPVPVEQKDSAQGELDWVETQRSWLQSWIAVVQRLAAQGRDLVGDVPQPPDQAALPGRPATDAEISSFHGIAEAIWKTLLEHAQDPDSVTGPRILNMVQDVQHLGGMVHSQPVLVISCRQGVIALAHLLNSRILGLDGFAPQTLQEWANPHEVLGRGLTPHGHLATGKTDDEAEAVLLDQDCKGIALLWLIASAHVADCRAPPYPASVHGTVTGAPTPAAATNWPVESTSLVQVTHSRRFRGDSILAVQPVPRVQHLHELEIPIMHPAAGADNPHAAGPNHLRPVAVFVAGHQAGVPTTVAVDVRLHGMQMHRVLLQLLGLSFQLWHVHELQTLLPSLPPEQVVVVPNEVAWNQACIPVDLCALGGGYSVVRGPRQQLASYFLVAAARSQDLPLDLGRTVCLTRHGFFDPSCQALLLHGNDALQALPVYDVEYSLEPPTSSTTSHRLALSSSSVPSQGLDDLPNPWQRAAVITLNGLVFYDTDPFQDREGLLRSAYLAVEDTTPIFLLRVYPPMPGLPPVQFVQAIASAWQTTYVVDARPVGGEINIVYLGPRAPVRDVLLQLPTYRSVGPVGSDIVARIREGELRALFREAEVGVDTALPGHAPLAILIAPGRAQSLPADPDRASRAVPAPNGRLEVVYHDAATHLRVQQTILSGFEGDFMPIVTGFGSLFHSVELRVCLWAPDDFEEFKFPGSASRNLLMSRLTETARRWGRGNVVAASFAPSALAIHFVAVTTEPGIRTVLFTTGTNCACLDVERDPPRDSLLRLCSDRLKSDCIRLLPMPTPLRHGDVVRVEADFDFNGADVSRFLLYAESLSPSRWLASPAYRQLVVLGKRNGVSILHDADLSRSAFCAAEEWVRECLGARPVVREVPELSGLLGFPCFQSVRIGHTNAVLWLHDHFGSGDTGLAFAVEGTFSSAVDVFEACARSSSTARAVCSIVSNADLRTVRTVHGVFADASNTRTLYVQMAFDLQALPGGCFSVFRQRATLIGSRAKSGRDLQVLHCDEQDVTCVIRCGPHMQIWALNVEGIWLSACTAHLSWEAIASVGGASSWDIADLTVASGQLWWRYPQNLEDASGKCLHLHQSCAPCFANPSPPPAPVLTGTAFGLVSALSAGKFSWWLPVLWALSAEARPGHRAATSSEGSANDSTSDGNASFPVSTVALEDQHDHCYDPPQGWAMQASIAAGNFPVEADRLYGWLCSLTQEAHDIRLWGFRPEQHDLYVACDTDPFTLELIAVPRGQGYWWIVRDLLSRELLRPVARLPCAGCLIAATVNSAGEVNALAHHSRIAVCHSLPQGCRATVVNPVDGFTGVLGPAGLVLTAGLAGPRGWPVWALLLTATVTLAQAHVSAPGVGWTMPFWASWGRTSGGPLGTLAMQQAQLAPARVYTAIRIWVVDHSSPMYLAGPPWPSEEEIHNIVQLCGYGVAKGTLVAVRSPPGQTVYEAIYAPAHFTSAGISVCLVQLEGRAAVFSFESSLFDWGVFARWFRDTFREDHAHPQALSFRIGNCGYTFGQAVQVRNGEHLVLAEARQQYTSYLPPPDPWSQDSALLPHPHLLQAGPLREAPLVALLTQPTVSPGNVFHKRGQELSRDIRQRRLPRQCFQGSKTILAQHKASCLAFAQSLWLLPQMGLPQNAAAPDQLTLRLLSCAPCETTLRAVLSAPPDTCVMHTGWSISLGPLPLRPWPMMTEPARRFRALQALMAWSVLLRVATSCSCNMPFYMGVPGLKLLRQLILTTFGCRFGFIAPSPPVHLPRSSCHRWVMAAFHHGAFSKITPACMGGRHVTVVEAEASCTHSFGRADRDRILWADGYAPVWPSPVACELAVVPTPPDPTTVCIVARVWHATVALLLPRVVTVEWLLRTLRHAFGRHALTLTLPPQLRRQATAATSYIQLRSGDYVLAIPETARPGTTATDDESFVRHAVAWNLPFQILTPIRLRLWRPGQSMPQQLELPQGDTWDPDFLSFASFSRAHVAGSWVPVPWVSDEIPNMVCTASHGREVLGLHIHADRPIALRDGDIIISAPATPTSSDPETAALTNAMSGADSSSVCKLVPPLGVALCSLIPRGFPQGLCLLVTLGGAGAMDPEGQVDSESATRPRSRSPPPGFLASTMTSPPGQFDAVPLDALLTGDDPSVSVVQLWCPFAGVSAPTAVSLASFWQQVETLATVHSPIGSTGANVCNPPVRQGTLQLVTRAPEEFVTVLVEGLGQIFAMMLPAVITYDALKTTMTIRVGVPVKIGAPLPCLISGNADFKLYLRNGDRLTIGLASSHPLRLDLCCPWFSTWVEAGVAAIWHAPFKVAEAGEVVLWTPDQAPTVVTIPASSEWDPRGLTIRSPGSGALNGRWVPAPVRPSRRPWLLRRAPRRFSRTILFSGHTLSCTHVNPAQAAAQLEAGAYVVSSGMNSNGPPVPDPDLRDGDWLADGATGRAGPRPLLSPIIFVLVAASGTLRLSRSLWIPVLCISFSYVLCGAGLLGQDLPTGNARPSAASLFSAGLGAGHLYPYHRTRVPCPSPLNCYLAAWGAPAPSTRLRREDTGAVYRDMTDVAALQVGILNAWGAPLHTLMPGNGHAAKMWQAFPSWPGGFPTLFLSPRTARDKGMAKWYPIPPDQRHPSFASFHAEMAALYAAAAWISTYCSLHEMWCSSRPASVTIAVDNTAALGIAAGQATAQTAAAKSLRCLWQLVQAKHSTRFCHTPGHTGVFVNEVVDTLAGLASQGLEWNHLPRLTAASLSLAMDEHGPWLWALHRCTMLAGTPWLQLSAGDEPLPTEPKEAKEAPVAAPPEHDPQSVTSLPIVLVSANVQTIKDDKRHFFSAAAGGQRRAFLVRQADSLGLDVLCLQECRSNPGRYSSGPFLTWRSGHEKGQYGVEVWFRRMWQGHHLQLQDWRILSASPRWLLVRCLRPDVPLAILSAHAPHAERPEQEIHQFWAAIRHALHPLPPHTTLIVGIDANADFTAPDAEHRLIGDLTDSRPPREGDVELLSFVQDHHLEAPATWSSIHQGPTWTWQHSSGKQRRHDHILVAAGHITVDESKRLPEFDIVNSTLDHATATHIAPEVWAGFKYPGGPHRATLALASRYHRLASRHRQASGIIPRQPYISDEAVQVLTELKADRKILRQQARTCTLNQLHLAFKAWAARSAPIEHIRVGIRIGHRAYARTWLRVLRAREHAHFLARRDKAEHFRKLTATATEFWLDTGRAMEATHRLKWASRKAAERRKVFAAGGHDIDADLLLQFQRQEAGSRVTKQGLNINADAKSSTKHPGREPLHFKAAIVCALHKKGPASVPANYRSIALLNGIAKVWHGQVRDSLGQEVLAAYHPLQLGGRRGVHTGFAVSVFRSLTALSDYANRSWFALFLDVQAAYYEADRDLLFGCHAADDRQLRATSLASGLLRDGVLRRRGMAKEAVCLLEDCVRCSHWTLAGHDAIILAGRGSRPGDGLADVLFGAIFAQILDDVEQQLAAQGIGHHSAVEAVGGICRPFQVAWADDLSVLTDADSAEELEAIVPVVTRTIVDTAESYRLRVNLGAGKSEGLLLLRGPGAREARGRLFLPQSQVTFAPGRTLRIVAEYKYLGVPQTAPDNGRRDAEASVQRGQAAWAQAHGLMRSPTLPFAVKLAWFTGRVLPAAYSSLSTALVTSGRVWSIYQGFFDRCQRALVSSWQVSHHLTREALDILVQATTPAVAVVVARARLTVQIATSAPPAVLDLVEACCERDLPWTNLLRDSLTQVGRLSGLTEAQLQDSPMRVARAHCRLLRGACKRMGRYGSCLMAFQRVWRTRATHTSTGTIGTPQPVSCPECGWTGRSQQALAAHRHRKQGILARATALCDGTTCSWCLRDFHSSDRLKYHISTTPACRLSLEISVGPHHTYGSGSKRRGPQQHRRLPPLRISGPINATPAEREAATNGQPWAPDALQQEWDKLLSQSLGEGPAGPPSDQVCPQPTMPAPVAAPSTTPAPVLLAFTLAVDSSLPSPWWPGLCRRPACWRFPPVWNQLAAFWHILATSEWAGPRLLSQFRTATRLLDNGADVPAFCPSTGSPFASGSELLLRHTLSLLHLGKFVGLGHCLCSEQPPGLQLRAVLLHLCPNAAWLLLASQQRPVGACSAAPAFCVVLRDAENEKEEEEEEEKEEKEEEEEEEEEKEEEEEEEEEDSELDDTDNNDDSEMNMMKQNKMMMMMMMMLWITILLMLVQTTHHKHHA
ncbi:unnamed protein product [Symbiodinium sp. CCMP2592]|nr:unnamed protein product [Symbiodinium sp. CCMP2592]